jgi:predicted dehydrogenase
MSRLKSVKKKDAAVRFGVVGLGNMGSYYARLLHQKQIPGAELAAVCDIQLSQCQRAALEGVPTYSCLEQLLLSNKCEAVVIATPHPSHAALATLALQAGLHVLVDKPLTVHKAEAEKLLAVKRKPRQQFGLVFNQRTDPHYQKVREMVQGGELGRIHRATWTITDWFRTNAYYASGDWRATWSGEGGGVLINQSVHNLDLLVWMFGQPQAVQALAIPGKHHPIEVEDEVSAIFRYADGKFINFITSTGEAPGLNRLEIAGSRGLLTLTENTLRFQHNEVDSAEFLQTAKEGYVRPPVWESKIPLPQSRGPQHAGILRNFAAAVRGEETLIAPAKDGLHTVELINATIWAGLTGKLINLPLSSQAYARFLAGLAANSQPRQKLPTVDRSQWGKTHHFGQ